MRIVMSDTQPRTGTARELALVVIPHPKTLRRVTRVMLGMGLELITCHSLADALKWLDRARVDLFVYQSAGAASGLDPAMIAQCRQRVPAVLLCDSPEALLADEALGSASPHGLAAVVGQWTDSDLLRICRKFLEHSSFGVEKHLNWGSAIHTGKITRSAERPALLGQLEQFIGQLQCNSRTALRALTAAEEFLMNAFYDAPVDAAGVHTHAALPRTHEVELDAGKTVTLEYGSDGENIVIGCCDPFGSLQADRALGALTRCLRGGDDQVQQGHGGAGLGLYLAYQNLDNVLINVAPQQRTELVGIIGIGAHAQRSAAAGKALQLFVASP